MKKLDLFILKAFIGPFVAILMIVIFILMMQFLWLYIDELVGKGLSLGVVLEFMMWGSCTILPTALPLATMLASVMTVGSMTENNELIAIKAAGVPLTRVLAPIFASCLVICCLAFFAANNLVPISYNKIYTLRDDIGRTKEEIKIPAGTFYDGIEGYILRVDSHSDKTGMMYGVMVYDHTGNKGNTSLVLADSAIMKMSKKKDYLTFELYSGADYEETNVQKYRDTTRQVQRLFFDRQTLIIPLKNYSFQKSGDTRYSDAVKTMPLKMLVHGSDSLSMLKDSAKTAQMERVARPEELLLRKQLDTAWTARVSSTYEGDGKVMEWSSNRQKQDALNEASSKASALAAILESYGRDVYEYTYVLRRSDLEILKKFSGALACLVLFFIGAPLGALIGKGGLGSSAITSILFFVLYWVVDITGSKLSRDGAVSAAAGAFAACIVLMLIGLYLTWKAVNDSALFSGEGFKSGWRQIKSRIAGMIIKKKIVFFGTPEFAVASLDAIVKAGHHVVGVVTAPDRPVGRGLKMNESAVKKYAVEHGLNVLQPEKLRDEGFLAELGALKGDLFVVVGFRMLPEAVWKMPKLGTFNLHAALLPQYRGAAPINWSIINGERQTGVTTFMIDKNIDTGGIILRQEYLMAEKETAGTLHDALMGIGADLVVQTVTGIIEHNVETRIQRSFIQGAEVLKPAPKLTRELCHIDWDDSSRQIYNLIRGLSPLPCAFTELVREGAAPVQLKVFSAAIAPEGLVPEGLAPGTISSDGKGWMAVSTADGAILLEDVQLSGKKRMPIKAFLAGFREPASYSTTKGTSKAEILKTRE